jgi:hypothetical protein
MRDRHCDICGGPGGGTFIAASQMRDAAERGFHPFVAGIVMPPHFAAAAPPVRDQILARWHRQVADDTGDWDLCGRCYPTVRRYLTEEPMPLGITESWVSVAQPPAAERTVLQTLVEEGSYRPRAGTEIIGHFDPTVAPFQVFPGMRIGLDVDGGATLARKLGLPSPELVMGPFESALGDARVRAFLMTTTVGPFIRTYAVGPQDDVDRGSMVVIEMQLNTLANLLLRHAAFAAVSSPIAFARVAAAVAAEADG